MPLKELFKTLHKNHKQTVNESLDWFNEFSSDTKLNEVVKVQGNYFLRPGKIYRFFYTPIDANTLPYYDQNPLIISLGKIEFPNNVVDLGLNLNYFP